MRAGRELEPTVGHQAPEMYIAKTPEEGIDALSEASGLPVPGVAECTIYSLGPSDTGDEALYIAMPLEDVYNVCTSALPGNRFVPISRDKYGNFYALNCLSEDEDDGTGTGTGTGTGPASVEGPCSALAKLRRTDCVSIVALGQEVIGTWDGSGWQSTDAIQYLTGTQAGTVRFWFANGAPHLSIDGMELLYCDENTFIGGPLTGHADQTDGSACDGTTFIARVNCTCCSIEGWQGPGWYCIRDVLYTGTSEGTGEVECTAAELFDEDRCDYTIAICSGPYSTEAQANAACGEPETVMLCEIIEMPATLRLRWPNDYIHDGVNSNYQFCDPEVATLAGTITLLHYNVGTGKYEGSVTLACGTVNFVITPNCLGGTFINWTSTSSGGFILTGGPTGIRDMSAGPLDVGGSGGNNVSPGTCCSNLFSGGDYDNFWQLLE